MKKELGIFQNEITFSQENRPLGELSNFVVNDLGILLDSFRVSNSLKFTELLLKLDQILLELSSANKFESVTDDNHALAMLDMLFLLHALSYIQNSPNFAQLDKELKNVIGKSSRIIESVTSRLCTVGKRPRILTYEDLIFVNPINSDPRLFTTGTVAKSEKGFYHGHAIMEVCLKDAIINIDTISTILKNGHVEGELFEVVSRLLDQAINSLLQISGPMQSYARELSKVDFQYFRPYFNPFQEKNLPGPSGAFSGSFPILDLELAGCMLDPEIIQYIESNIDFYPKADQLKIIDLISDRNRLSLLQLCQNVQNEELCSKCEKLSSILRIIRGSHLAAVGKHIPEVIESGNAEGTGGSTNVREFLEKRIRLKH